MERKDELFLFRKRALHGLVPPLSSSPAGKVRRTVLSGALHGLVPPLSSSPARKVRRTVLSGNLLYPSFMGWPECACLVAARR
jgi:hypothetical protein